jgi:hypothetical protein
MEMIQRVELTSTQSSIVFNSIPQGFTDLAISLSGRSTTADVTQYVTFTFNGSTSGYSFRYLFGNGGIGAGVFTTSGSRSDMLGPIISGANATANTFGNAQIYIPNYTASQTKSISIDGVMEQNSAEAYPQIWAGQWANNAPITSITLNAAPNFAAGSSATLYGIKKFAGDKTPKAIGGTAQLINGFWVHTFTTSGDFTPLENLSNVEYLVVAGGGGGNGAGGGGGAGGYRSSVVGELSGGGASAEARLSLTSGINYAVLVGAGGAGDGTPSGDQATSGSNSSFGTIITAIGGGKGGIFGNAGSSGGSGGGGGPQGGGGAGTANQGYGGGVGFWNGLSANRGGGGGGGAGGTGSNASSGTGGAGGAGRTSSITGTAIARAGGGGGEGFTTGAAGQAGGGNGGNASSNGGNATANTGSGGGGAGDSLIGGNGASGIVIVRYAA